jgi:hypothetical protein
MAKFSQNEKNFPNPKGAQKEGESIKRLFVQIRKMPELSEQAKVIDQVLLQRVETIRGTASNVIEQFSEQRKTILQKFDNLIMPIAKEVLDGFLKDADRLKSQLDENLDHIESITPEEWTDQANDWAQIYEQWHDSKGLMDRIFEVISDRTKFLIDKDIQVIEDYQTQSLSHLSPESEAFKNLEERLKEAIEDPLKQLMALRKNTDHKTIQQASEWIAKLQAKRETCFDQLLMKIDNVMKEVVPVDEPIDADTFNEIEGEIIFMERELDHINQDLSLIHLSDESDRQFIAGRLEGLLDHAEEMLDLFLPNVLKNRMDVLIEEIRRSLPLVQ